MFVAVRLQSHEFNSKNVECFNRNAVSEEIICESSSHAKEDGDEQRGGSENLEESSVSRGFSFFKRNRRLHGTGCVEFGGFCGDVAVGGFEISRFSYGA